MDKRISVVASQDNVVIGKLEGEQASGVYLSAANLARLAEILNAAKFRITALPESDRADALLNLVGVLDKIFEEHSTATVAEKSAELDALRKVLTYAKAQLKDIWKR